MRIQVLNPLLVASEDLLERVRDIHRRRADPAKCADLPRWFATAKDRRGSDPRAYTLWANDEATSRCPRRTSQRCMLAPTPH